MEEGNIKYTDYIPVQPYSIEDLSKLLYVPDRDIETKTIESLADIAEKSKKLVDRPIQYLDSLEFLDNDTSVDIEKYKKKIGELTSNTWNYDKSPAILDNFLKKFSYDIGPNGEIGKGIAREEAYKNWISNKENDTALRTLDRDSNAYLSNEIKKRLISNDNISEMYRTVLESSVAATPDFNDILSNENIKSIIGNSEYDTKFSSHIKKDIIGLPKDIAASVINGIIGQDQSIKKWLEQYNRIHNTQYDLNDCCSYNSETKKIEIKEDLPDELKSAINDAWGRATAASQILNPYNIGNSNSNSNSNSNYNGLQKDPPNETLTQEYTIAVDNIASTGQFANLSNLEYESQFEDFYESIKATVTAGQINSKYKPVYEKLCREDWESLLQLEKTSGLYNSDYTDLEKVNNLTEKLKENSFRVNRVQNKKTKQEETWLFQGTGDNTRKIVKLPDKAEIENVAHLVRRILLALNTNSLKNENIISKVTYRYFNKIPKGYININDFNVISQTENGIYVKSDDTTGIKQINKITGYSYGNRFGKVSLIAEVTMKDDKTKNIILSPKNSSAIENSIQIINQYMSDYDKTHGYKFLMDNLEYADLLYRLNNSKIYIDNKRKNIWYSDIIFTSELAKQLGLPYIPVAFYGMKMRTYYTKEGNEGFKNSYHFVDEKGNEKPFKANDFSEMIALMYNYFDKYENPKNLKIDDDINDYFEMRIHGYKFDANGDEGGSPEFFPYNSSDELEKDADGDLKTYLEGKISGKFNNERLDLVENETDAIYTGDLYYDQATNEYYMITTYGNDYILVDARGRYKGKLPQYIDNDSNYKIYRGENRGIRIGNYR